MPSNHFILCHPLLFSPSIFPSIRVFSNESVLRIRWPKYWSFRFSISPSNDYSGLTSFRMDWLDQNDLVVFPTFFNLSLNLAIRSSWSWPVSSRSCFCWPYRASPSLASKKIISLLSVLTVWWYPGVKSSLVLLRGCSLWPVCSLGKTLLAFALLHSVLQGQICLLLQVFLDFLLLHSSPLYWKGHYFLGVSSKRSCRSS